MMDRDQVIRDLLKNVAELKELIAIVEQFGTPEDREQMMRILLDNRIVRDYQEDGAGPVPEDEDWAIRHGYF